LNAGAKSPRFVFLAAENPAPFSCIFGFYNFTAQASSSTMPPFKTQEAAMRRVSIMMLALYFSLSGSHSFGADDHRIVFTGGFLGQIDGFNELPATARRANSNTPGTEKQSTASIPRTPAGGVLGVESWLVKNRKPGDLLLIGGNNFPTHFEERKSDCSPAVPVPVPFDTSDLFWQHLVELKADAIALAREDFLRVVHPDPQSKSQSASLKTFVDWLNKDGACGMHFLASNVLLKKKLKVPNSVETVGASLDLPVETSVDLSDELSVKFEKVRNRANLSSYTFCLEGTASGMPEHAVLWPGAKPEPCGAKPSRGESAKVGTASSKVTLKMTAPLRPGYKYTLTIWTPTEPTPVQIGPFVTHDTLGPRSDLSGTPTRIVGKDDSFRLIVLGMVDPDVKKLFPDKYWQYTDDAGNTVTLDFVSASDAADWWRRTITDTVDNCGAGVHNSCVFTLLSDLTDAQNLELFDNHPELRITSLHPDSLLLGRVALATNNFSGDLGYYAISNSQDPAFTDLWVRPEWIGETVIDVDVKFKPANWPELTPTAKHEDIEGVALMSVAAPMTINYILDNKTVATSPRYPYPNPATWTDRVKFAEYVADTVRTSGHSELGIIPLEWIDADMVSLIRDCTTSPLQSCQGLLSAGLSTLILERVIYRQERIVKTTMSGSDLSKLLKSISDDTQGDNGYCVVGIEPSGCQLKYKASDDNQRRVNGRLVIDDAYYSVAVSEGFAAAHKLVQAVKRYDPVIEAVNKDLLAPKSPPPNIDVQKRLNTRGWFFFNLAAPKVELSRQRLGVPKDSSRDIFSNIPIVSGRGAKDTDKFTFQTTLETGFALRRVDAFIRSELNLDGTRVANEKSYDSNLLSGGVLARYRFENSRYPLAVFGGLFVETSARREESKVSSSYEVTEQVQVGGNLVDLKGSAKGPDFKFIGRRPVYRFKGFGIESLMPRKWRYVNLTQFRTEIDFGKNVRNPEGVKIGNVLQPADSKGKAAIDVYQEEGQSGFVNEYLKAHPELVKPIDPANPPDPISLELDYHRRQENRFDTKASFEPVAWTNKFEASYKVAITLEHQVWFNREKLTSLSPDWAFDLKFELHFPFWWRLEAVPYYDRYLVRIDGATSAFHWKNYGIKVQLPAFAKARHGRVLF
jgi:hypothetical protein